MNPTDFFNVFLDYWPIVVTIASAISMVTPSPVDNQVLKFVKNVVDTMALNVGRATTAERLQAKTGQIINRRK
jgi:ABC-type transporter lipoprotein component MlaA